MSAYGAIRSKRPSSSLPTTRWTVQDKTTGSPIKIYLYHFTLEMASKSPGLLDYLHSIFAQIVEEGRTYPMEVAEGEAYSKEAFESYFFAADVIVGVRTVEDPGLHLVDRRDGVEIVSGTSSPFGPS